jgi:hypothetical protein
MAGRHSFQRGEQVAAFGYPLGESLGSGLKLTKGVISAITDDAKVPEPLYEIIDGQRVELPPMSVYATWVASRVACV